VDISRLTCFNTSEYNFPPKGAHVMASSTASASDSVLRVPLTQIEPSKHNARKAGLNPEDLQELANSIKQNGVIVPIKLRDIGEKKFRIVFGERRFRASLLAFEGGSVEALTIPATVHTMTDEQEEEERAIENLQRADLAPMEEAQEFKRLLAKGSTADLAAKLGKEESYIVKRLKLLSMIPEAQKALATDHIQLGHALELCRLDPDNQKRVLKFLTGEIQVNAAPKGQYDWQNLKSTVTVEGLRQFIQSKLLVNLDRAKFDLKDPELNPKMGACTACPHNTANTAALFADIKSARCTLPECFYGKEEKALDNKLAALAAERGVEKIYRLSDGGSQHENRGLGSVKVDGYYSPHNSAIALVSAGKECDYTVPAVFVHVDEDRYRSKDEKKFKVGDETNVCLDAKCKEHRKSYESGSARGPLKGLALVNHKEENLGKSRKQRTRNEAFKQIVAKMVEDDTFPKALLGKLNVIVPYAATHLYSDRWRDAGKALGIEKPASKQYSGPNWEGAITKMFDGNAWGLMLCIVMAEDLPASGDTWRGKGSKGALSTFAEFYKVDLAKISSEFLAQDREAIKAMRANAEKKAAAEKTKSKKKAKAAKPKRGTCQFCQCTMTTPCNPPCAWVNKNQTICSAPPCLGKAKAAGLLKAAKPKKAAKKG
jgi:ParB/RepB/Spo0J family partition protein